MKTRCSMNLSGCASFFFGGGGAPLLGGRLIWKVVHHYLGPHHYQTRTTIFFGGGCTLPGAAPCETRGMTSRPSSRPRTPGPPSPQKMKQSISRGGLAPVLPSHLAAPSSTLRLVGHFLYRGGKFTRWKNCGVQRADWHHADPPPDRPQLLGPIFFKN